MTTKSRLIGFVFSPPTLLYVGLFALLAVALGVTCRRSWTFYVVVLLLTPSMWTIQEYAAHRWLMHGPIEFIRTSHAGHHRWPLDHRRLFIPMVFTICFAVGNFTAWWIAAGWEWATWSVIGNVLSYFVFELCHWLCHTDTNTGIERIDRLITAVRRHHLNHHVKGATHASFGFTSPTWDYLFSTLPDQAKPTQLLDRVITCIPLPLIPFLLQRS